LHRHLGDEPETARQLLLQFGYRLRDVQSLCGDDAQVDASVAQRGHETRCIVASR